jgi:hypothetical protein
MQYYDLYSKEEAGEHDLRIATIFTYGSNEDSDEANDSLPDDEQEYDWAAEPKATINQVTAEIKKAILAIITPCMARVTRPRIVNRFKIFQSKYQQKIKRARKGKFQQ